MATNGAPSTTIQHADERTATNFAPSMNRRFQHSPEPSSSPVPSMDRRASSFRAASTRTDSSSYEGRSFSFKTTTEDLLSPKATSEHAEQQVEASLWYSVPLLLAIVPAVGSLAFKGGSVFLTDLSLLVLAAIYLNWFLVTPWTWYESARSISLVDHSPLDVAVEDPIEEEDEVEDGETTSETQPKSTPKKTSPASQTKEVKDAVGELHLHEATALILCFLGPLMGAYLLHTVRASFSEIMGHQMVSNVHLTLFALGAELRPMRHAIKLIHARTLFLQRVVRQDPSMAEKSDSNETLQAITRRLDEIETCVADLPLKAVPPTSSSSESSEHVRKIQNTLQTQIDALNRAVRRYEKRATAQTMQTEARLQDLESRLRDALSLAAIAANYSQKPGVVSVMLDVSSRLISLPLKAIRSTCMYPLLLLNNVTMKVMVLTGLALDERSGSAGIASKSKLNGRHVGGMKESLSLRKTRY